MIVICYMINGAVFRLVAPSLEVRIRVMPAVVVTRARQAGKCTLAQELTQGCRRFVTLDDFDSLDAARLNPEALFGGSEPVTIGEVQREPDLLHAVKRAIDQESQPGQFLLTGSANLHLMRRVSESLAGRAGYLTRWPMTRREQLGLGRGGIWDELLQAQDKDWPAVVNAQPDLSEDWRSLARRGRGGTPALQLTADQTRDVWFDGYVRTYLERDLQLL